MVWAPGLQMLLPTGTGDSVFEEELCLLKSLKGNNGHHNARDRSNAQNCSNGRSWTGNQPETHCHSASRMPIFSIDFHPWCLVASPTIWYYIFGPLNEVTLLQSLDSDTNYTSFTAQIPKDCEPALAAETPAALRGNKSMERKWSERATMRQRVTCPP